MIIYLNGFAENIPEGITIKDLIDRFNEKDPDLIVELSGKYIFPKKYNSQTILENDVVEFINPNLGG